MNKSTNSRHSDNSSISTSTITTTTTTIRKPILKTKSFQFKPANEEIQKAFKTRKSKEFTSTTFKSITEDTEHRKSSEILTNTELDSDSIKKYEYETFESDESSQASAVELHKKPRAATLSNTFSYSSEFTREATKSYSDIFEPSTCSKSEESISSIKDTVVKVDFNKNKIAELKKKNYVDYAIMKIRLDKEKQPMPTVSVDKAQIRKWISRIEKSDSNRNMENEIENSERNWKQFLKEKEQKELKISPYLINKLETINCVNRIKQEQTNKIDNEFGNSLLKTYYYSKENNINSQADEEKRNRELYIRLKLSKIHSNQTDKHFIDHEINYCDSIMLIANLAKSLPRHSDPPEKIWAELMRPLNDKKSQ